MPHKMMNPQIAYVLHDNRMSIEARMLYAYLCSFDDGVPPSTYQMIRQLGIGKTRFYRYRNELEAFGLIEVENKITSGGGVAKYSFPDKPVPTAEAEEILITRLINNNNKAMNFKTGTSRMLTPQCRWKVLMIWNNTGLIDLRIRSRHLKTVLMHNIRQMSVVAFSTVHVKYLTTVISTNIK